ncbi:MAG: hypothetical protein V4613_08650 [Bacteroidota bacterium]
MKNNIKLFILVAALAAFTACKKTETENPPQSTRPPSKKELLNQVWVLKETFENGMQKTTNGTGRYEFNRYGNFRAEISGTFKDIGTYKFTTTDSNELKVTLTGVMTPYTWKILKLDDKNLQTEFMSGTTKNNYNYAR